MRLLLVALVKFFFYPCRKNSSKHLFSDSRLTPFSSPLSAAIKVNCQGSCGISSKMNEASWTLEEQYFNSTLSVADKGDDRKFLMIFFSFSETHRCMNGLLFLYFPSSGWSSFTSVHTKRKLATYYIIHLICTTVNETSGCLEVKEN